MWSFSRGLVVCSGSTDHETSRNSEESWPDSSIRKLDSLQGWCVSVTISLLHSSRYVKLKSVNWENRREKSVFIFGKWRENERQ